jgi:Ca2+-binding EF-hand superfamily protein
MMRRMDENFDGKISYQEMSLQVRKLGLAGKGEVVPTSSPESFKWRDKAIEKLIRAINANLNKTPFEKFFDKFDKDHDGNLKPDEFRQALQSLNGVDSLKPFQIERILHVLRETRKVQPEISINRLCKFLKNYQFNEAGEQGSTLID